MKKTVSIHSGMLVCCLKKVSPSFSRTLMHYLKFLEEIREYYVTINAWQGFSYVTGVVDRLLCG